jgi:hypothetical protein
MFSNTRTCFKSSSACCLIAAFGSRVAWIRSRSTAMSMVAMFIRECVLGFGDEADKLSALV